MKSVYEAALSDLRSGKKGLIAVIVSGSGSTPRGIGAKMYVDEDGKIVETIGGGPSEYAVIKASAEVIKEGKTVIKTFDMSGQSRESSSVCGGNAKVLMYPVTEKDAPLLEAVINAAESRILAKLYIWLDGDESCFVYSDDNKELTGIKENSEEIIKACRLSYVHDDKRVAYTESLAPENRVILLGAGHVAYFTAIVSQAAGFKTVVVDDRAEFANEERFSGCEIVVPKAINELPIDMITGNDYVVIVTRGHNDDEAALEWALGSNAAYIGMIGSKTKCKNIFDRLTEKGFKKERLDEVHAPIGLNIGGRTPGEIAVSIMAEIIQIKSSLKGRL